MRGMGAVVVVCGFIFSRDIFFFSQSACNDADVLAVELYFGVTGGV